MRGLPANRVGYGLGLGVRKLMLPSCPEVVDSEVYGLRLRLHPRDNLTERKLLYLPQFFDREERAAIANLVEGSTVVDIGANIGIYSLLAAMRIGASGRVFAVEPNPLLQARLRTNLALNGFGGRVEVVGAAVSDRSGHCELSVHQGNLGEASIVKTVTGAETVRVECCTLRELLEQHHVTRIDMLKIDVEGAEDRVLLPFLEACPESLLPGTVIIEDSSNMWSGDPVARLRDKGYGVRSKSGLNLVLDRDG